MNKKLFIITLLFVMFGTISYTNASIGDVVLRFCNGTGDVTKTLSFDMETEQEENICMQITNGSNEKMNLMLGFVDGTVTNDLDQRKACRNEGQNNRFGKYVMGDKDSFVLNAGETLEKTAKILFPDGTNGGKIYGCVTYFEAPEGVDGGETLKIVVRKANFIDVNLSGEVNYGLELLSFEDTKLSKNPKINVFIDKDTGELISKINLKNNGSVSQNVKIEGKIKNIFGYTTTFESSERKIVANDEVVISSSVKNLPFYKGPFTVEYEVTHIADLNEVGGDIPEEMKIERTIVESTNICVRSIVFYVLIGILIIIILLIWKRKKDNKNSKNKTKTNHRRTKK